MSNIQFSDLQILNLTALITVRDSILQDVVSACSKFGLTADQASVYSALSIDRIIATVANVGQESLFLPRQDLVSLLELPIPLSGPMAAVHPPHASAQQRPLNKAECTH